MLTTNLIWLEALVFPSDYWQTTRTNWYTNWTSKQIIRYLYTWFSGIYVSVCDENPFSILETGTRIALFWSRVRDENENFFFSISCFERRMRIFFFNLILRDENGNFFFKSRASRREREILFFNLRLRDENENRDYENSRENFREY